MKPSDFEKWLAALSSLSAAQRRIAFRELALADADGPGEVGVEIGTPASAAGTDAKASEERGEAAATPLPRALAPINTICNKRETQPAKPRQGADQAPITCRHSN